MISCQSNQIHVGYGEKYKPLKRLVESKSLIMFGHIRGLTVGEDVYVSSFEDFKIHSMLGSDFYHDFLSHECVHSSRQKKMGLFFWLLYYLIDSEFRLNEEKLAFYVMIKREMSRNELVDIDLYALVLSENYYGMTSFEDARLWVISVMDGSWSPPHGSIPPLLIEVDKNE